MEKDDELFIPKTKHKALKIILAIILLGGLIASGYYLYQYKFNNPKVIINKILDKAKNNIDNAIKEDSKNDKYKIDGHIKINANNSDSSIINILKDVELQFNGEADTSKEIGNFTINSKYKNDKLFDLNLYYEKDDIYVLFDELYDKYIKYEKDEIEDDNPFGKDLKSSDIKIILNSIIDALKVEINKLDVKRAEAKITFDGKEVEVINNFVELKDKEASNFIIGIIKTLKNNKNFVEVLTKISSDDGNTILDELIKEEEEEPFEGIYKLSFYTNKGLLNKQLLSVRQTITAKNNKTNINMDIINKDEILLTISNNDEEISLQTKKNNSAINLILSEKTEDMTFSIELNMNYEKIKEVSEMDITNSKAYSALTKEELANIEIKLSKNQTLLKLLEEFEKMNYQEA